jgi:Sporulation and spore germination/Immunoglobulin-like domain of bacterial spore germination
VTAHPAPLALVMGAALLLTGCSDDATVAGPGAPSASATTPAPATTPPPTSPPTEEPTAAPSTAAPAGSRAVAVYYLRDTTGGPRLYREFHRRPATSAVVRDAVTAMLTEAARDGDYTSLWPKGTTVRGVRKDGTTLVVDLSKEASSMSAGAAFEGASLQQLVWTATAADPTAKAVQLLVDGRRVGSLTGHVDTSEPMPRGQAAEELGAVWVLTPDEGGTVRRGGTFGGEASVFEANVSWQLVQSGKVVKEGFSTASAGAPARGRWTGVADVPPGDYVLRAFESSAEDGRETFVDDKRITVTPA